jgi:hypothetical protein
MEKIFNQESFNYFACMPCVVELTYRYIFSFNLTLSSLLLFPLFAPDINNTSSTSGKIYRRCGVVDTGGNTGVVDTGGVP